MPAHDATVPQKASGNHVPVSAASTNSARVLNSLRRYQMLRTPGDGEVRLWPIAAMGWTDGFRLEPAFEEWFILPAPKSREVAVEGVLPCNCRCPLLPKWIAWTSAVKLAELLAPSAIVWLPAAKRLVGVRSQSQSVTTPCGCPIKVRVRNR